MTIIAAARDATGAYLACDLMQNAGGVICTARTKLVLTERWAMGFAGIARFRQLAQHIAATLDECERVRDVAEALRVAIIEDGAQRNEGRGESPSFDIEIVLVDRRTGDLFRIVGDFTGIEQDKFVAAGSGVEVALGAMWAISSRYRNVGARELVEIAVTAASELSAGCGRGMVVEKVWAPHAPQIDDAQWEASCLTPGAQFALKCGWRPEESERRERTQDFVDVLCSEPERLTVLQAQQIEGGF